MADGRPAAPVRAVIFDLDGTLVQTRVASWEIFRRISDRFELGVDEPEQYYRLFRGNVFASIRELCRDDAHAAEVNAAFLDLLRTEYTPPLVPGVAEVVRRLASDCTLAVMSSNAMAVLRRVLVANDLAFCFAHVFGGDVTPDKRTAMRSFLADAGTGFGRRCAADYDEADPRRDADSASTVLVTDTAGDVRDAREVGIRAVGVTWGMHSAEELTAAGAEFVALWPQELTAHLLGDAASRPPGGACAVPAIHRPAGRATTSAITPAATNDAVPDKAEAGGGCGCDCSGKGCPVARFAGPGPGPDRPRDDAARAAAIRRDRRRALVSVARTADDPVSAVSPDGRPVAGEPARRPANASSSRPSRPSTAAADELMAALRRICPTR
ncbi:HAD family hydrolase [Nakamurella flava]|uniref:HAD family hydrolase n=1 Tax=Nakamurella flava TaxID=2576308 RepID=UPI001F114A00|nr:HAD hydrolase-like protein [Nakamurella flava]